MKAKLYIVLPDSSLKYASTYDSYKEALDSGQDLAPGNFHIDTGSYIPSREEQLGYVNPKPLPKPTKKTLALAQED